MVGRPQGDVFQPGNPAQNLISLRLYGTGLLRIFAFQCAMLFQNRVRDLQLAQVMQQPGDSILAQVSLDNPARSARNRANCATPANAASYKDSWLDDLGEQQRQLP